MTKKQAKKRPSSVVKKKPNIPPVIATTSLLEEMVDGREFESLLKCTAVDLDLVAEIRQAIKDIQSIRKNPLLCYVANVVNSGIRGSISIDNNDDLPFSEMIHSVPADTKEVDILLVTPGGSGQQVAKFVDRLRPRFDKVTFILPNMTMSAGTMFSMSGNEIIMSPQAYIGPIDPQIPDKSGRFVPAQAILTLIDKIQEDGEASIQAGKNPKWTDMQILRQIEGKEIGNAINASDYSVEMVEDFLYKYKFKTWSNHSDGSPVTEDEKKTRANEIASLLCNHGVWKTHSRGISREVAWDVCQLKITHTESIGELDRYVRRMWALLYWAFENTHIIKVLISNDYCIIRNDNSLNK